MAIDTRNKRSSAIHVGLPWRGMFPLADGTLDQADQQHACGFYAGILAGEADTPTVYYLPRIDVYGARGVHRIDVFGTLSPRLNVDGASVPRLDVFGGEG